VKGFSTRIKHPKPSPSSILPQRRKQYIMHIEDGYTKFIVLEKPAITS
jgi:hypothetical protein